MKDSFNILARWVMAPPALMVSPNETFSPSPVPHATIGCNDLIIKLQG